MASRKPNKNKNKGRRLTFKAESAAPQQRFVWIDGARLSLPTANLQGRMSRLKNLDDAWSLQGVWVMEYEWYNGYPPADPDESFRKVMQDCRRRILQQRRNFN